MSAVHPRELEFDYDCSEEKKKKKSKRKEEIERGREISSSSFRKIEKRRTRKKEGVKSAKRHLKTIKPHEKRARLLLQQDKQKKIERSDKTKELQRLGVMNTQDENREEKEG